MSSERGNVSILSVLLSLGIMSILIFGVISHMRSLALAVQSGNQNTSIENAMAHVTAAFGADERYCTSILAGRVGFKPNNPVGEKVNQISFYNLMNDKQTDILSAGKTFDPSGVRIKEIRLVPVTMLTANTALAELVFSFEKGQEALGGSQITRALPLYVGFNSAGIVFCSTTAFGLYTVPQRICQHNGWGFSSYNPMYNYLIPAAPPGTAACADIAAVEWVKGLTLDEADCGSNRRLAVPSRFQSRPDLPSLKLCKVSRQGAIALPPRTYMADGGVFRTVTQPQPASASKAHPASDSCEFEHLSTVLEGSAPVQTYVRCVPR
ncbi:hypothetical protein ACLSU7_05540 [Bdellovibrio sp. HCB185ZH]|uniref:hypothetical protein n=1 Tax=Bdellovibrio sp. HCB185ZH TaxID=3394235 RepID=UPI0039A5E097